MTADPSSAVQPDPDRSASSPSVAPVAEEVSTSGPGPAAPSSTEPGLVESATDGAAPETDDADRSLWGVVSRSIALGALLGAALMVYGRGVFVNGWVSAFVSRNALDMPARMRLLALMIAGAGVGVVAVSATCTALYKKQRDLALVERWLWWLSPALLLPALPMLFDAKAWQGEHEQLLPVVVLLGLLCETLVFQAARNVPSQVSAWWRGLQREVPAFVARHGWVIAVTLACLGYALFMSFYTIRWHHKLGTAIFDLGINNNLIYGGLEGKFNQSPVIFPEDPQKYVANHLKLGLYVFLPLYALVPRAETLLVVQSFALGFGALPLFLFARRRVPQWVAAVLALAFLAYYPMHGANFYEMKLPPVGSFFVLMTIWAIDAKRWVTSWVFFFLTLILREDMPVGLAVAAACFLLSGARPRIGAAMAIIATSWFVFVRFKLMNEVGHWWFPRMYEDLWSPGEHGFKSVIKTLVTNPIFTLRHIIVEKKVYYLLHLLAPLAFLPARRWYLWAAFIPGGILTLLVTDYSPPVMFSFQYVMHWAPYIFIAAALCLAQLQRRGDFGPQRMQAAICTVALASSILSYNYGAFSRRARSLEAGYHKITFDFTDKERKTYAQLQEILQVIPAKATVAATEKVGAHASSRSGFYTLRRGSHDVDYMLARKQELRLDRTREVIFAGVSSGEYGVLRRIGDLAVFKKGHDTSGNAAIIKDWDLAPAPKRKRADRAAPRPRSKAATATPPRSATGTGDAPEDDDTTDSDPEAPLHE